MSGRGAWRRLAAALALGAAASAGGAAAQAQPVSAILQPAEVVEIKSSVAGRIAQIAVREGQQMQTGGALARLDAQVQQARVGLAQTAVEASAGTERAAILIAQAEALVTRVRKARSKGAAQAWEVTQAEQALELARADARLAAETAEQRAAQLRLEEATLAQFTMTAPFDGTVLRVMVETGAIVSPDTAVIEFAALSRLKATAFVPLDWALQMQVGAQIPAQIQSRPPRRAQMEVTGIDPRIDPASQTVRVTLEIENPDGALFVGTPVQIPEP